MSSEKFSIYMLTSLLFSKFVSSFKNYGIFHSISLQKKKKVIQINQKKISRFHSINVVVSGSTHSYALEKPVFGILFHNNFSFILFSAKIEKYWYLVLFLSYTHYLPIKNII